MAENKSSWEIRENAEAFLDNERSTVPGAKPLRDLLSTFGHDAAMIITSAVPNAFVSGNTHGFMLDSVLGLVGFLVALFYVAGRLRLGK